MVLDKIPISGFRTVITFHHDNPQSFMNQLYTISENLSERKSDEIGLR